MNAATLFSTLQWIGVVPSCSRLRVSSDNLYSETFFGTMKYRRGFPGGAFACPTTGVDKLGIFVSRSNTDHPHSAICFVAPDGRHSGRDVEVSKDLQAVFEATSARQPERWSGSTRN